MRETIRRVLALIGPHDRAAWIGLALLAGLVTVVEIAAALLIFMITRLVSGLDGPIELPLLGDPRARVPRLGDRQVLVLSMALVAGFFLIRAGLILVQSYLRARLSERMGVRLSSRLFRGYLGMPYAQHLQRNSAELIRNVNDAVKDVVDYTLIPSLRLASEILVICGLGLALVVTAPAAAALAAVLFVPLLALLFRVIQPRIAALGRSSHEMGRWAVSTLQQSLHGFRDIAIFDRREYFAQEYERVREEIGRTRYLRQLLGDVPRIALETGLVLFVAALVAVWAVTGRSAQDSVAVLGMFAYAALRILPSVSRVVLQVNELKFGSASAATVHQDLVAMEGAGTGASASPRSEPSASLPLRHAIRLEKVRYRYPGADQNAIDGVDLEIGRGESIGIVGPTGGGKSTLIDLVLGLLRPGSGQILVDGIDVHTQLDGWQRNLGVVPQSVYLLDTTLRRNIALGVDDVAIDDDRVMEAIGRAQLDRFVAELPEGLGTVVGERGVRLSGGERQRVAIARALYRHPAVLVFDEGTSALDNETESELLKALASLRLGRTLLIVAHRLSTVRDCDRILVVEGGRIVDSGTFDGLIHRSPAFRRLAAAGRSTSEATITTSTSA